LKVNLTPVLSSERLTYEPLTSKHISAAYLGWMNDPDIYQYLETRGNYTLEDLTSYVSNIEQRDIYFWAIHLKTNGKHVGNIKIDPINKRHGIGEYGILMGDKTEWGKGYAREASLRILYYCFNELQLRKITLGVVENNSAALHLYKKIGFQIEGIYKDHGFYNGNLCNIIRMAIFKQ